MESRNKNRKGRGKTRNKKGVTKVTTTRTEDKGGASNEDCHVKRPRQEIMRGLKEKDQRNEVGETNTDMKTTEAEARYPSKQQ